MIAMVLFLERLSPVETALPGGYNEVKLVADDASAGATTVDQTS
jgi:hypothetical protein